MLNRILPWLHPNPTNQERLEVLRIPHFNWPSKYLCHFTGKVLDNPVALEDDAGNFDADRIVDQTWLQEYWKANDGKNNMLNPFNRKPLQFPPLALDELKQEIEKYINEQERLAALNDKLVCINRQLEDILSHATALNKEATEIKDQIATADDSAMNNIIKSTLSTHAILQLQLMRSHLSSDQHTKKAEPSLPPLHTSQLMALPTIQAGTHSEAELKQSGLVTAVEPTASSDNLILKRMA
jgi:hypothetical protein